jgi:hypothetical protein
MPLLLQYCYRDGLEDGWSLGFDAGIEEAYGGNSEKDNQ